MEWSGRDTGKQGEKAMDAVPGGRPGGQAWSDQEYKRGEKSRGESEQGGEKRS